MSDNFFAKQTRSSRIKANIVSEYFPQYCRIILRAGQEEIRYLDLFSGPGIYDDGSVSTPILIAEACAKDSTLSTTVKLMFNDNEYMGQLKQNFESRFPKGTFTHETIFGSSTVGEDERIRRYLIKKWNVQGKNPHPTLLFIDPFGYKGIDTSVLAKFMDNWGNEIFLFLNTKRIHAAIENDKFDDLMLALFPTTFSEIKKDRKYKLRVEERLNLIIENLVKEYNNILNIKLYHTAFRFQEEDSAATSHYILHFTKHSKGYELVKQIYHDFDNIGAVLERDGTYTFDAKKLDMDSSALMDFGDQNVYALSKQLKEKYKGKKLTALRLFNEHQATGKFCRTHYAKTLRKMVEDGDLISSFSDGEHKVSVLITDYCTLQFN